MADDINSRDEDEIIASINVTPMVDIILVILIIFMVTSHFLNPPVIPVELPQAANVEPGKLRSFSLVLREDGSLYMNGKKVDAPQVYSRLKDGISLNPDLNVIIAADGRVMHKSVVRLIDLVKSAGVRKFALEVKRYQGSKL